MLPRYHSASAANATMQPIPAGERLLFNASLVLASLVLSALAAWRYPVVGADGIQHLMLAREAAASGIVASVGSFTLPLYPVLIGTLHRASSLSLLACAQVLDAALLALLAVNITRFATRLCGEQALAAWIALLVLLFPQLNGYRSVVAPDAGFWALLFGALLPLLRYRTSQRWQDGLCWAAFGLGAAAFRLEALAYLLLLPLVFLRADAPGARSMATARLYGCIGVLLLPPALVLARLGLLQIPLDAIADALHGSARALGDGFVAARTTYASTVLDPHARGMATLSLTAGLLTVLALKAAEVFGILYCMLLGWGVVRRRAALPTAARRTWRALLLIAILIAGCFVLGHRFVGVRDVMALCLLALVPTAQALRSLALAARDARRERAFLFSAGVAIALLLIDGFARTPSA